MEHVNESHWLVQQGFPGYIGWGVTEAEADFNATGGAGKGGGGGGGGGPASAEQIVNDILKAQEESIKRETEFLDKYVADNPFVFDEELARRSSEAEYKPYYSELLEDYLQDVEGKRATIEDETKLLKDLHRIDVGTSTRAYTRAVSQAEEGFAGQGMFFSGIKKRAIGQREVEQKSGEERREERFGFGERELGRRGEQLDIGEERQRRDIFGEGRAFETATEGGILQRRGEAIKGYNIPLQQAYSRQFPTGSNQLSGYLVPDYLRY